MENFHSQILAVSLVLLLLGGLVWISKRRGLASLRAFGSGTSGPEIVVLSRRVLTPQHTLFLIEVCGQSLLVGTAPGQCRLLTRMDRTGAGTVGHDS